MPDTVLVISCSEDGDKKIDRMTKTDLIDRLDEQWWGENVQFCHPDEIPNLDTFVGIIVIDGKIVQPKPVEKVTRWTRWTL